MAFDFIVANRFITQTIDLTATPQAVLTNSSTYDRSSLVATVTAQEISGNGYSRPTLTVSSNQVNASGYGVLTYSRFTITAAGGAIQFDRIALIADGDWVGYCNTGTTTIADGQSKTYSLQFSRGESGVILSGVDGVSAYTVTTANFTQPAANATVNVPVESSSWLAKNAIVFFQDGTNEGYYQVTNIGGNTLTLKNLNSGGSAIAGTVMLSGGSLVIGGAVGPASSIAIGTVTGLPAGSSPTITNVGSSSTAVLNFGIPAGATGATGDTGAQGIQGIQGVQGPSGVAGFGLRFVFNAATTSSVATGELRLNNASPNLATQIYTHANDRNAVDVSSISSGLSVGTTVLIFDESDDTAWALYTIASTPVDAGTSVSIPVTYLGHSGTFAGNVSLSYGLKGSATRISDDGVSIAERGTLNFTGTITATDNPGNNSIDVALGATVTTQGNTFNGANQLVQLTGTGALPAVSGANLTNLPAGPGVTVANEGVDVVARTKINFTGAIEAVDNAGFSRTDISLDSTVTLQGNTFNGANQLVKLTATGVLPALSAVNLTNLPTAAHVIADDGVNLTQRATLNFIGSGVTVTDNSGLGTTDVTIASGGGHTIEDEGTPLTQRTKLNFVGSGVTATDDAGNDRTIVTIASGGLSAATTGEIQAGTSNTVAITPLGLASVGLGISGVVALPATAASLVRNGVYRVRNTGRSLTLDNTFADGFAFTTMPDDNLYTWSVTASGTAFRNKDSTTIASPYTVAGGASFLYDSTANQWIIFN